MEKKGVKQWISSTSLGLVGLLALPGMVSANAIQFSADFDVSDWQVTASKLSCELNHEVPGYGTANFTRNAGERLTFSVTSKLRHEAGSTFVVLSTSPPWFQEQSSEVLDEMNVASERVPVSLPYSISKRLYLDLDQGRSPAIHFPDWAAPEEPLNVVLSPINFRAAEIKFQKCLENLLPFGFADMHTNNVYFRVGESTLDQFSKALLNKVAAYVKADKGLSRVNLAGHADSRGERRQNKKLSKRRADIVAKYLRQQGVKKSMLKIDFLGTRRPQSTNRTPRGLAENRSVTVKLIPKPTTF